MPEHHSVCPWWMGYLLASPVRRLWQDPASIVAPYVREGMTVFEPGPGMGFFTLELARRVGASGRVVVVDVQPEMLDRLKRRLAKAGLLERVDVRAAPAHSMGIADLAETIDLVFAFAVVHEFPSARTFFLEAAESLKPGGRMLLAEPAGHVTSAQFESELADAARANLHPVDRPVIRRSRAAVLQ
jgi:ubiquinone/menaquinone biosynthesis C-methylase UbiE